MLFSSRLAVWGAVNGSTISVTRLGDGQGRAEGNVDRPLGGLPRVSGAAVAGLRQTLADLRGVAAAGAR